MLGTWLSDADFNNWGWRLPFLASAILVILGLWIRLKLTETPEYAQMRSEEETAHVPLADILRTHFATTLAGTFAVVACFAIFYITTAFALGYGTVQMGVERSDFLMLQLGAILFMALSIILAGWWADKASPLRVLIAGCLMTIPMGMAFGSLLGSGNYILIWSGLSIGLFAMGFVYGPLGAWLPSLFPIRLRYTGVSFAFNLGGIIGGALAPIVAQALVDLYGVATAGLYMSAAAIISLIALWLKGTEQPRNR